MEDFPAIVMLGTSGVYFLLKVGKFPAFVMLGTSMGAVVPRAGRYT